jgi:hypothetical protein
MARFWAWAVHCLYFLTQIESSHGSHTILIEFNCFLHALSLDLAFHVAVAVSVLFMNSPSFTQRHADAEHLPVAIVLVIFYSGALRASSFALGWYVVFSASIACLLLAFTLLPADIYILNEELFVHYRPPLHFVRAPFLMRISAITWGPALVLLVWSLMFTT